ncbi:MAG: copper transport protein [Sclerophora amabilis]|nr:MAG: copper transport protein [Sclerophora amabilis]
MSSENAEEKLPRQVRARAIALKVVLGGIESHFKTPGLLDEKRMDMSMELAKETLVETQKQSEVRMLLGHKPDLWNLLSSCLSHAIVAFEVRSLAVNDPIASAHGGSAASIAASFTYLQKDVERVNDICMIARNMLVTKHTAQDLAANARFHLEVLKLIDLCVRVAAKGYDGEGGVRLEEKWQRIATGFKRLLITCLQFLNNFITNNERRKLLLWMDLFGGSPSADLSFMGHINPAAYDEQQSDEDADTMALRASNYSKFGASLKSYDKRYADKDTTSSAEGLSEKDTALSLERERYLTEKVQDLKNELSELNLHHSESHLAAKSEDRVRGDENREVAATKSGTRSVSSPEAFRRSTLPDRPVGSPFPSVSNIGKSDHNDPRNSGDGYVVECTPSKAALNLQTAKDQLIERLHEDSELQLGSSPYEGRSGDVEHYDDQDEAAPGSDMAAGGSVEDDEDGYQASLDRDRGLLTDIPLVLGPNEIEALPMIIQAGIVDAFASPNPEGIHDNMQAIRCNILISQESGRGLLRELLIFIAAWDLVEEALYFKIMMQITDAILKNGLVPFTYQSFAEAKDIVSPAQAVFIKLLTQIFRTRQSTIAAASNQPPSINPNSRVELLVIRYMFTQFREFVIPETCALIYLQGQIRNGVVHPEDFPLNLWDMERVYEGVYQFLEFFAVLTETEDWKSMLVDWEVTFELVTLLKELEMGIPKGQLFPRTPASTDPRPGAAGPVPQDASSSAESKQPAPVAVERPYDVVSPSPADSPSRASSTAPLGAENPEDFEWRNLKKLVILVLSSLVWKSTEVQDQVRNHGGVEMVLQCCNFDSSNPYIREHAIMCLRFLLEGNEANMQVVRQLEPRQVVPSEVLDKRGYETFIDEKGKVGLRRKDGLPAAAAAAAAAAAGRAGNSNTNNTSSSKSTAGKT